ncbi:AAA family ATPase [Streptomyces sp. NPDC006339]|uniref:ATP-binding protein n=1 Tax=Streptomyces sp. NPDC006339 TaxID=3156755 RepID=UPI0033B8FF37
MTAHTGGPSGHGFRLFEREAELAVAEEALNLLTGHATDPSRPPRDPAATEGPTEGPADGPVPPARRTGTATVLRLVRGTGEPGESDGLGEPDGPGAPDGSGASDETSEPGGSGGSGDPSGPGASGGSGGSGDPSAPGASGAPDGSGGSGELNGPREPRGPGVPGGSGGSDGSTDPSEPGGSDGPGGAGEPGEPSDPDAPRAPRGAGQGATEPARRADRAVRRGGVLAVAAGAGLGKTTLLAEIRRRATAKGCTVLSARGGDEERSGAFHVARQLLQPRLAAASRAELRERLGDRYDLVGPALGLCPAGEDGTPDPRELSDGLDRLLTHLAVPGAPLVVVLDDAHGADPESLRWLAALAARAEELPLLLVVSYRPGELPADAAVFTITRSGRPPLALEPLTPTALARLVRDRVGAHADDGFCRAYWTATSGNPLQAVRLAARIRDRGLAPTADHIADLRHLAAATGEDGDLVARIERLGTDTVRLAWACAVLGTDITPRLAGAVAGLGGEEVARGAALLRRAGVLAEARGGRGTDEETAELVFVHPFIATAVYEAIPAATRVALHGQAAWCVVEAGLGSTAAARHLVETHPDGDPWVVRHLRAAARDSLRAGAPDTARRYLARALREPPDRDERAAILRELRRAPLLTEPASPLAEPATPIDHARATPADPPPSPAPPHHGTADRHSQALTPGDHPVEQLDAPGRPRTRPDTPLRAVTPADGPDSPAFPS